MSVTITKTEILEAFRGQLSEEHEMKPETKLRQVDPLLDVFKEATALFEQSDFLEDGVWALMEYLEVNTPERRCSCHVHPPCSDCVDYGYQRDLIKKMKRALESRAKDECSEDDDVVI